MIVLGSWHYGDVKYLILTLIQCSYFRQLQEISDSVAEVTWETTIVEEIEKTEAEEANCNKKINELQARGRFLNNLVENDEKEEEDRICVLCRCDFTKGFITHWYGTFLCSRRFIIMLIID